MLAYILIFNIGVGRAENFEIIKTEDNKEEMSKANYSVLLKIADAAFQDAQYETAAAHYSICIANNTEPNQVVLHKLADCYWQMRNYSKALERYQLIPREQCNNLVKFRMAELNARNGNYKVAADWLQDVPGYNLKVDTYKRKKLISDIKKDSLSWKIEFSSINSDFSEFSPLLKNNTLFYCTNKPIAEKKANGWDGNNYAYLMEISSLLANNSAIDSTEYKTASKLNTKTNSNPTDIYECGANEPSQKNYRKLLKDKVLSIDDNNKLGKLVIVEDKTKYNIATISMDNNAKVYFASNYDKSNRQGVNHVCLMEGRYSNTKGITDVKKLAFGDPKSYSVMHPTVNSEGTLLIFSSDKANGNGGYDLYYAQRNSIQESWGEVHIFGKNMNTIGNEVFPTITDDGFVFFSSDGMAGLGGLDIYYLSVENALNDTGWAEHIGYPLNSSADDFGWTQDQTGKKGFFSSDRNSNNDNIYSFIYTGNNFKIVRKLVYGFVSDKTTSLPLEDATVFMYSNDDKQVYFTKTDKNGKYQFQVNKSGKITIKVAAKSYLSDCILVDIDNLSSGQGFGKNPPQNIMLSSANVGDIIWRTSDINYDFDKSEIRPDAAVVLNQLSILLKKNDLTIEISSHTDSRGNDAYNLVLSQKRAEAVVDYLVKQGVDKTNIVAKGYGESRLINRCSDDIDCTAAEHQANRRTEVKVIENVKVNDNDKLYKLKDKEKININSFPKDFFNYCQ